jgi:pentatricopeptide repeat protein
VPVESGDKKTKKPKKMKFDARRDDLIECVRSRDHSLALRIYAEATSTDSLTASTLYSLLSTCTKAEHLDSAVLFFNDLIKFGASPLEQAYLALIRCYTDANRFQEVVSIVKSMHELNIEVRHRTFQPILEAHLRNNDIESILTLLFKMISLGVHPRSEQIAVLLYCCSKTDATAYKSAIDAVILESSKDLIGLEFVAMKDLKRVSEGGLTIEQVEEQGILVDSFECVPGKVLEKTDSFVIAQNASFDVFSSVESLEDMRVGNRAATTTSLPSNATVLEPAAAPVVSREGEVDVDFNRGQMELFVEDRYVVRPEAFEPLRVNVVDIASSSCRCPNCGARIQSIPLSEETKHSARVGLMRVASAASVGHCRSLQAFGSWLEDRPQYRYIIDGANVAYNKQNFGSGRFSYRQIEFVVDSLRKQTNDRVLVLIPQNYVNRVVPNSAKNRVGVRFSQTTADDQVRTVPRLASPTFIEYVHAHCSGYWSGSRRRTCCTWCPPEVRTVHNIATASAVRAD